MPLKWHPVCSLNASHVTGHMVLFTNIKNIFVHKPEFAIHQLPEQPEIYITLFKMPTQEDVEQKESVNIQ